MIDIYRQKNVESTCLERVRANSCRKNSSGTYAGLLKMRVQSPLGWMALSISYITSSFIIISR